MKIRNNLMVIAALCFAVFILGACGYWNSPDDQGSIRINFENSGARYAVTNNDKTTMNYTITLTSPGKNTITRTTEQGDASITITPVSGGMWNIQVDAEGTRVTGRGNTGVWVTAGQTASANIKMAVTGTRVSSWSELVTDFKDASLQNHSIEIVNGFPTSSSLPLELKGIVKTITLWAKKDVTITRSDHMNSDPVFLMEDCTLILDGTKGGTITIQGNNNPDCTRALINVEKNSTLRILNGVTITKNISAGTTGGGFGGGIYVKGGTFFMEGGVISGNTAKTSGGGVHITESGTFIKTGGIIYGYDAEANNRNVVSNDDSVINTKGHAVYYSSSKYSDRTLGENDNWSTSP